MFRNSKVDQDNKSGLGKVISPSSCSVFVMDPGDPKLITTYSKSSISG